MIRFERACLRDSIPEIAIAADFMADAVSAHQAGDFDGAERLFRMADMQKIREWTESIWGAKSPYNTIIEVSTSVLLVPKKDRAPSRMPNEDEKKSLIDRDGYHCRFCGIPLVRSRVRTVLHSIYKQSIPWGRKSQEQHAGFQAMWLQYDHIVPHARGGTNSLDNLVITCAPCNYGRMNYLLEEFGLAHPFSRDPAKSSWDGLERVLVL